MGWNEQSRYGINEHEVLSVWGTGQSFVVRLDNTKNNSAYILLESQEQDVCQRFFDLMKEAYEELIY